MDGKSRHRLIGAVVLLASSAVVLPLILDGERPVELDELIQIPTEPDFPLVEIAPVKPLSAVAAGEGEVENEPVSSVAEIELVPDPKLASPVSSGQLSRQQADAANVKAEVKKPSAKAASAQPTVPIGDRWTVQIATFKNRENATRLVSKLNEADYNAYAVTTNSLYKVYVGPELKRSAAEQILVDIQKEFSLKGFVVKYAPNP